MHDFLSTRAADLSRLAMTIQTNLNSVEYTEYLGRHHGEPTDLRPRFVPYANCLPLVRAMLVAHVGEMLDRLMRDVRLLG